MVLSSTAFYTVVVETREANAAADILEAAVQEFDEAEYVAASINKIAQRAGISKSLVSYHFPNKAYLATTIVNLAYPSGVFMGMERQASDPLDALVEAVEHVATSVAHHQLARVAIKLHHRRELRGDGSPAKYSGWLARISDYPKEAQQIELIAHDTDVPSQARLVIAGVVGLISMASGSGDYFTLVDDTIDLTRDRITVLMPHSSASSSDTLGSKNGTKSEPDDSGQTVETSALQVVPRDELR